MQTTKPTYFTDYRGLKMTRDAEGVLVVEFHSNGGPLNFTAQDHTGFVDAFYRISQDRANKIVILTGTGGEFIPTDVSVSMRVETRSISGLKLLRPTSDGGCSRSTD
jgi:hypothetical protein